jgi:hypothetical protein
LRDVLGWGWKWVTGLLQSSQIRWNWDLQIYLRMTHVQVSQIFMPILRKLLRSWFMKPFQHPQWIVVHWASLKRKHIFWWVCFEWHIQSWLR